MATIQWKVNTRGVVSIMTTELDNLAADTVATSGEISNDAAGELDLFIDLVLLVDFDATPAVGDTVDVFINRMTDGTNYATEADGPMEFVGAMSVANADTSDQRLVLNQLEIPPDDFKVTLVSNGNGLGASGHTLKAIFYSYQTT